MCGGTGKYSNKNHQSPRPPTSIHPNEETTVIDIRSTAEAEVQTPAQESAQPTQSATRAPQNHLGHAHAGACMPWVQPETTCKQFVRSTCTAKPNVTWFLETVCVWSKRCLVRQRCSPLRRESYLWQWATASALCADFPDITCAAQRCLANSTGRDHPDAPALAGRHAKRRKEKNAALRLPLSTSQPPLPIPAQNQRRCRSHRPLRNCPAAWAACCHCFRQLHGRSRAGGAGERAWKIDPQNPSPKGVRRSGQCGLSPPGRRCPHCSSSAPLPARPPVWGRTLCQSPCSTTKQRAVNRSPVGPTDNVEVLILF